MSRVQLALNVADLDEAIGFYSKLFATEPAKVRPGLRQLRRGRPAAQARPDRGRHPGAGLAQPPRRRGGEHRRGRGRPSPTWRPPSWPPRSKSRWRVASPSRTRCGSTAPAVSRGRSTPCSPTPRCPPVSFVRPTRAARRAVPRGPTWLSPGRRRPAAERRTDGQDHGARESSMDDHPLWRRLLAELLGSAFLAAVVIGSGIAAQQLSPGDVGLQLFENAAATAAGLFAIILMFGPVSGAHFNPVVSFVDAAFGGLRLARRRRLPARPGGRLCRRRDRGQPHVQPRPRSASRPSTGPRAPTSSPRSWPPSGCCW